MLYLVVWLIVRQLVNVTAFIEGFLVHGFGVVKQCRSDDISESRLLMESGMFFRIDGG